MGNPVSQELLKSIRLIQRIGSRDGFRAEECGRLEEELTAFKSKKGGVWETLYLESHRRTL
jgi:hypothetical protein